MRTIHFSCDPQALRRLSDDQHAALLHAIGRQVLYAQSYAPDDATVQAYLSVFVLPDGVELPLSLVRPDEHSFTVVGISDSTALKYSYHS